MHKLASASRASESKYAQVGDSKLSESKYAQVIKSKLRERE